MKISRPSTRGASSYRDAGDDPLQGKSPPSGIQGQGLVAVVRDIVFPWVLLMGLCGLIFWQSSGPVPTRVPSVPGLDKLVHAAVYALLAFLAARAFATLPRPYTSLALARAAAIFAILYGLSDELHQAFIPARTADIWDLVADAFGAIVGATAYHRRMQGRARR